MIDSVLKRTGNSRFLKSAVPAGTSWADALAMLQAGTFPIDFNGINTEGFQQVGTPLNKANLLKDATAAQIGLPPSTTPDGMFQALGNTGELHVWRKTVVTSNDVPAGYTLGAGEQTTLIIKSQYGSGTQYANVEYGNTCAVYDNGEPYIPNSTTTSNFTVTNSSTLATLNSTLKGKFCKFHAVSGSNRLTVSDGVFFIPSNATFQNEIPTSGDTKITVDVAQKVNAYPLTHAGTTTTYPVSTNPNAYQEGEYGKAGYTLGDVKTGTFQIGQGATTVDANRAIIKYGASISVTDTGTASIASESEKTVTSDTNQASVDGLKGKFFRFSQLPFSSSAFSVGKFYFFPANTVFTKQSSGNWYASKYQTVTSHGKTEPEYTIEYLGKLGDKARVQVVSYVGTGTNGPDNPCSITANFKIKVAVMLGSNQAGSDIVDYFSYNYRRVVVLANLLSTEYKDSFGFGYWSSNSSDYYRYSKTSADGKTLSWYWDQKGTPERQYNVSGRTYYVLIIG